MANKTLNDIPLEQVHLAQQAALVRLQLFITGEVHRLLLKVADTAVDLLHKGSKTDPLSAVIVRQVRQNTLNAWAGFITDYTKLVGTGMYIAAAFPFGGLAVYHHHLVVPVVGEFYESLRPRGVRYLLTEKETPRAPDGLFKPQLEQVIQATYKRVYDDGLNLSGRIWRLDAQTRKGIDQVIYNALAKGLSAWDTAEQLEQYLGAGRDCPRWTYKRLTGLTKKDIAGGNKTGLVTGSECDGQGVSYNALRLARTEIQAAHHAANDLVFQKMPWVTEEQINLSPAHAEEDECDEVVEGGRDGKGIYPKGEIKLPLHPNCLCFKTALLMDNDEFIDKLRGWMGNTGDWVEMDEYADLVGGSTFVDLAQNGIAMLMDYWLWEAGEAVGALFWQIADGGL